MLVIRWWGSSWYSSGPANSLLYRSFVVPFGGAGFRSLDSRITFITEKHTAGCCPNRPLAVTGKRAFVMSWNGSRCLLEIPAVGIPVVACQDRTVSLHAAVRGADEIATALLFLTKDGEYRFSIERMNVADLHAVASAVVAVSKTVDPPILNATKVVNHMSFY
jgi:hypothetical protein